MSIETNIKYPKTTYYQRLNDYNDETNEIILNNKQPISIFISPYKKGSNSDKLFDFDSIKNIDQLYCCTYYYYYIIIQINRYLYPYEYEDYKNYIKLCNNDFC